MKILHLTIKKKWFDMILSGKKLEEYRELKPYWDKRIHSELTHVMFRNGYKPDSPNALFEIKKISTGEGRFAWGAPKGVKVWIIGLGGRIE